MIDFIRWLFGGERVSQGEPYPPPDTNGHNVANRDGDIICMVNEQVEGIARLLCNEEALSMCLYDSPLYSRETVNIHQNTRDHWIHHHCRDFYIVIHQPRCCSLMPHFVYYMFVSGVGVTPEYMEKRYKLKILDVLTEMKEFLLRDIQSNIIEQEAYYEEKERESEKRKAILIEGMSRAMCNF